MPRCFLSFAMLFLCCVGCKKEAPPAPEVAKPEKPVVSTPATPAPAPKKNNDGPAEKPDTVPNNATPSEPRSPQRVLASPEIAAELRAEAMAQPDNRLVVLGHSNLPEEMKLEISVTSKDQDKPLRASTAVRPDGTFRTSPLGPPKEGVAAGTYTIRVEVSPLRFQPTKVRSQFNNMDDSFRGPTINGPMGPATGVEFEFQK